MVAPWLLEEEKMMAVVELKLKRGVEGEWWVVVVVMGKGWEQRQVEETPTRRGFGDNSLLAETKYLLDHLHFEQNPYYHGQNNEEN